MAIKPEPVNGGKKIVLRHVSGSRKGELAGSVHIEGASGIAAPSDILTPKTTLVAEPAGADVAEAYAKFATGRTVPVIEQGEPVIPGISDHGQPAPIATAYQISALLGTGMDADQHADVFHALERSVKRWQDVADPTEEEWNRWLLTARAHLTNPNNNLSDEAREDALATWEDARNGGTPDGRTYALLTNAEKRMWRAKYALKEQAVQIASWIDADPAEVEANVAKFRAEYFEKLSKGEDVTIPGKYATAWSRTAGMAPKDPATAYSHFRAEDPTLYTDVTTTERFVALDLETTGLSTKDSHIIEIGLVEYDSKGNETGRWSQLVRPPLDEHGKVSTGNEIVMAVHNIKPEDVVDKPTFDQVLPELQKHLEGATIIGHNLAFDTKHLQVALRRYAPKDDPELGDVKWTGAADTMIHAARHMHGLENNKLVTVSAFLGIAYTNGHRAEHDAAVSGEVFFALRKGVKRLQNKAIRAAKAEAESSDA
jgi:DNA polymerase III epsilon subunit-like protein